jgi:hypothetical protein
MIESSEKMKRRRREPMRRQSAVGLQDSWRTWRESRTSRPMSSSSRKKRRRRGSSSTTTARETMMHTGMSMEVRMAVGALETRTRKMRILREGTVGIHPILRWPRRRGIISLVGQPRMRAEGDRGHNPRSQGISHLMRGISGRRKSLLKTMLIEMALRKRGNME